MRSEWGVMRPPGVSVTSLQGRGPEARGRGLWPGGVVCGLKGGSGSGQRGDGPMATMTCLRPQEEGGLSQQGGSVCTGSALQRQAGTSEASGSERGLGPPDTAGLSCPRPSSFHLLKTQHDLL